MCDYSSGRLDLVNFLLVCFPHTNTSLFKLILFSNKRRQSCTPANCTGCAAVAMTKSPHRLRYKHTAEHSGTPLWCFLLQ